jgi:protease-4
MFKSFFSGLRRILRLFWDGVSMVRRFVGNLLFLLLVILLLLSLFVFGRGRDVPDGAALIIDPSGYIVEQKAPSMLSGRLFGDEAQTETLLKDLIDAIDYAGDDGRIELLVLDLHKLAGAGPSKLQDIGAALMRFKNSGKQIIAHGDFFTQSQYYLAAHADHLYLSPMGGVGLYGYGVYRTYYRSALEKLRINFHVFRVGTFKSALEPFWRDDMSPDARESNLAWLNELWAYYKTDIAARRNIEPDIVDDYINNFPTHLAKFNGDTARLALDRNLVDAIKTRDEVRRELIDLVGEENDSGTFKQIDLKDYLQIIRPHLNMKNPLSPQVGVIVAKGMILDGDQPAGTIGGDSLADLIRQAREDDRINSLVLRIDTGGGSTFASELIRREIQLTRNSGKPVIISMGSVAASGGYWIATAADEIWASPTTITGSIGIFGAFATFEKSLDSLGIHNDGVGTTKLADAFDPSRPLNPLIKDAWQQMIEHGYDLFIKRVAEGRNMMPEDVEKIAQGRVWSGAAALKLGLVDQLGSLQEAVAAAAGRANLNNYEVSYIKKPLTSREKLIESLNRIFYGVVRDSALNNLPPALTELKDIRNDFKHFQRFNDPQGLYAYCLSCDFN